MKLFHTLSRVLGTPLMVRRDKADEILAYLSARMAGDVAVAGIQGAVMAPMPAPAPEDDTPIEGIAVISVEGPLVTRASGDFMSGGPTTYGDICEEFDKAMSDPNVKGIILDFDSPGGEVGGVFDLSDRIFAARGGKPIYSIANESMFSAAYATGSAGDRIYTTRTGGVGSIGVFTVHCDQSGFDEKLGAKFTYIFAGDKKVDGNPHEPLSDEARASIQADIDRIYGLFVDCVARNRNMSAGKVKATQADCYSGELAVTAGLADQVGTLEDAINDMSTQIRSLTPSPSTTGALAASEIPVKEASMPQPKAEEQETTETVETATEIATEPAKEDPAVAEKATAESIARAFDNGFAAAVEIVELCAIAQHPEMAVELLSGKVSSADVRKKLQALRASKDSEAGITSHVDVSANAETVLKKGAEEIAKRDGITKEAAYVKALNGDAYAAYLASRPK